MPIAADRLKYFWTPPGAPTALEPAPATFDGSEVMPCIDMSEYAEQLKVAIGKVGNDPDPAKNAGDFIYIAGWWLGFLGGVFIPDFGVTLPKTPSAGPTAVDLTAFDLDPTAAKNPLNELLIAKARAGVEVRTLGWIPYAIMTTHAAPIPIVGGLVNPFLANVIENAAAARFWVQVSAQTMNATKNLRKEPRIGANAMLNVIGHSAGSVHVKASLVGTRADGAGKCATVAFAGGLDLVADRWAAQGHLTDPTWKDVPSPPFWHDVQARIQGNAAQALYDHFREMWNENLRRIALRFYFEGEDFMSYVAGTTAVPPRNVSKPLIGAPALKHHVQSLRTIPAFNYRWYNCLPEGQAAKIAPEGLFEIRAAWRKALLAAERFIYLEDQYFFGAELFEWVNESLRMHPDLKVVVLMRGGADPNDAPSDDRQSLHESINVGLIGLGKPGRELTPAQLDRVRIFQAFGDRTTTTDTLTVNTVTILSPTRATVVFDRATQGTALPPDAIVKAEVYVSDGILYWLVVGNPALPTGASLTFDLDTSTFAPPKVGDVVTLSHTFGIFIHAKTGIIDDKWALIGSPNFMRRSLYTDWEYAISLLDENETAVRDYRARLWAEHFRMSTPADLNDLDVALGIWASAWNPAGTSPPLPVRPVGSPAPPYLRPVSLPLGNPGLTPAQLAERQDKLDTLDDVDSREPWGGLCPP